MITPDSAAELIGLLKKYLEAQKASERAMEGRMKLQAGATRARSTTANVRWAQAAEGRDRLQDAVQRMVDGLAESVTAKQVAVARPAPPPDFDIEAALRSLGPDLRRLRESREIRLGDLARALGCGVASLSMLELGERPGDPQVPGTSEFER